MAMFDLSVVGKTRAEFVHSGLYVAECDEIKSSRIAVGDLRERGLETGDSLRRVGVGLGIRRHSPDRCTGREGGQEDTEQKGGRFPVEMRNHDRLLCQRGSSLVERPHLATVLWPAQAREVLV
jgi:hypothetical protein